MNTLLEELIEQVKTSHGKDLSLYDSLFLEGVLKNRRTVLGLADLEGYMRYMEVNGLEVDSLMQALTVTYSQFFRDPFTFSLLQQSILPMLRNRKPDTELRIWSAGCAGGQEAYSLAILLEDAIAIENKPIRYRIFATDISSSALYMGRQGKYCEDAVQNLTLRQIHDYFTKEGGDFSVNLRLQKQIDFSVYDLLDSSTAYPPQSIFGDFDLIFCSNLLFYYQPEIRVTILRKLTKALSAAGYLVTSETERGFVQGIHELSMVKPESTVFRAITT